MRNPKKIFVLLFLFASLAAAADKPRMEDVASRLSCYCGTCPHLVVTQCGCGTAEQIKVDVQKMIDAGMSSDQIVQSYVQKYGATVLAAPPKSGFNLAAWVIPFLGFISGSVVLVVFLKRQKNEPPDEKPKAVSARNEDPYREELERELELMK